MAGRRIHRGGQRRGPPGRVRRRQLGIIGAVVQLPRAVIVDLDLVSAFAVQVMGVDPSGIASRSGLREGDLIVSINDRIVTNIDDLHRYLARIPIETKLEVAIIRDGQSILTTLT